MATAARASGFAGLFDAVPSRPADLLLAGPHMAIDVSLRFVTPEMISLFGHALEETGAASWRDAMLAGESVNVTEGRPASHAVGRHRESPGAAPMLAMARAIRNGERRVSGRRVETVVNVGIGGSHLGPAMVHRALGHLADGPEVRFVSNVDPVALDTALAGIDLASTLFVVSSKSFTTPETLFNADRVRRRLAAVGLDPTGHLVAVTAEPDRARHWGIDAAAILAYPAGVGGRFSLSGPVGLPVAVAVGPERFGAMLNAMADMDRHFREAPASANLPVVHAIVTALDATVLGHRSLAVVAYAERLGLLVPYLQQLMMESNGKSVAIDGTPVAASGPAVWGGVGTDAQHAFMQWLHQGTDPTPTDFIIVGDAASDAQDPASRDATRMLVANALAQGEVLAFGTGPGPGPDPHRHLAGNRPSTRILLAGLSAETVGALVAFYEHSTVMQAWLMGINPFDQFGVEHGKGVAREIGDPDRSDRVDPADGGSSRWSAARRWLLGD